VTTWRIDVGDCRERLAELPERSVQTCVTSPPYFGLRDYGHDGQIGLEPTPDEFVAALVGVFREVRRVLCDDGTVWLNLGDSYARGFGGGSPGKKSATNAGSYADRESRPLPPGLKGKDLIGIPWMVAFALRADGWFLRSDIIWHKPNPMPESVTDRPTKAHEYLFLLSKSPRYYYDADAIREESIDPPGKSRGGSLSKLQVGDDYVAAHTHRGDAAYESSGRANRRSVWTVATQPYAGAHFATFPPKLIEPCILAGSREGDMVLDPFSGAGTTGMVALRNGRSFVGCELNPEYADLARFRIRDDAPLLNHAAEVAA
jgi:DNA modification methylase